MNPARYFRSIIATLAMTAAMTVWAEVPENYYKSAYNLAKENLKTALSKIINPHQQVSSYQALPTYFQQTDLYPNSNRWWDMYGDEPIYLPWNGSLLNREHSLPKSWWGGSASTPAYTDLNHLYPGEAEANQKKSNYPLGEVTSTSWTNGVSTIGVGANSGGAKYVFEPANEYKGDFARTYFYMVTCYQDMDWVTTWQVRNGTYPSLQQWAIDLLLKWHRQDPVSQKEQLRNEKVYDIQNNRNPFIDYPDLAEHIWGNKMGQTWNPSTSTTPPTKAVLTAPTNNTTIDFGQVALGKSVTRQMLVKGTDLTSNLRLIIGGTNASYFSVPGTTQTSTGATSMTIAYSAVNAPSGTWITMVYTPKELGEHNGSGNFSGGGVQGCAMKFHGECLPMPTLTAPTNPAATDVTSSGYIATWDVPADETVDYWVVTRKIYKGSNVTTQEDIAESNELPVDDFDQADYETFTVRSSRLGVDSPESEVVMVSRPTAIGTIDADQPIAVESFDGMIRLRCSAPQTGLRVYDMMGREVVSVAGPVDDLYEIIIPRGVYVIVTDQHRRPIKTVAR